MDARWTRSVVMGVMLLFACALGACSPESLNPLVAEKDAITDDRIVGRWEFGEKDASGKMIDLTISRGEGHAYDALYHFVPAPDGKGDEKEVTLRLSVLLTKIGDRVFADLTASERAMRDASEKAGLAFVIPVHHVQRVLIEQDALVQEWINAEWFKKLIKKEPGAIAHANVEGHGWMITASTADLRAFIAKHGDDAKVFASPWKWVRVKDAGPPVGAQSAPKLAPTAPAVVSPPETKK